MDQGLVELVVHRVTLLALTRGRPEAGRTGRAATSARSSAMMLAMSPTVVASTEREWSKCKGMQCLFGPTGRHVSSRHAKQNPQRSGP